MDIHSASYFLLPFCFLCPTLHIQKPWQCYNIHLWGLPNNIICLWHSDSTLSYFFLIKIFYALFKFNVHLTGGGRYFPVPFGPHLQSFLLYFSQLLSLFDFSISPSSFYGWQDFLISKITPEVDKIIPVLVEVSEDNQLEIKVHCTMFA